MRKFVGAILAVALLIAVFGSNVAVAKSKVSEKELTLGLQELEQENIIDAMQHFLRALPNEDAEKMISRFLAHIWPA